MSASTICVTTDGLFTHGKPWFPHLEDRELPDVPHTGFQLSLIIEEAMSASPDWLIHKTGENLYL